MNKEYRVLIIFLSLFLILSLQFISTAGYNANELLHAIPAQKILQQQHFRADYFEVLQLTIQNTTIPIQILYYVGALKSLILTLPLYLFQSSLTTIRLTTITLSLFATFLTFLYTKKYFNLPIAYGTLLLLTLDPSWLLSSIFDYGPVTVQRILTIIIVFTILKYFNLKTVSTRNQVVLYLLTGLALWDKVVAVWILAPSIILSQKLAWQKTSITTKKASIALMLTGIIGASIITHHLLTQPTQYTHQQKSTQPILTHSPTNPPHSPKNTQPSDLHSKITTLLQTIQGTAIPKYIYTDFNYTNISAGISILLLLSSISLIIFKRIHPPHQPTTIESIATITLTAFILILLTPFASNPHHFLILYPFIQIMIAHQIYYLYQNHNPHLAVLALLLIIIGNLTTLYHTHQTSSQLLKPIWYKTQPEHLVQILKNSPYRLIALDWGIMSAVGFVSQGSLKITEFTPRTSCNSNPNALYIGYTEKNPAYILDNNCRDTLQKLETLQINGYTIYMDKKN